ncbi:replication factor-A protein 1 [Mycena sp. CBHHK59/15]|nr:replication factor-A protein 1 [Mycena sp. CBHHK59/15]
MSQLSSGSCEALQNAAPGDSSLFDATHRLQLLSVRLVTSNTTAVDRYRIIISDGIHFIQAMLATQLNDLVRDNEIRKNTIVNVTKMTCNFVQDKRLLIILTLDVVAHSNEKIGSPVSLGGPEASGTSGGGGEASGSTSSHQASPAPPPVPQPVQQQHAPTPNSNRGAIYPIEGLSPYQNNWTIKARVIQKGEMKTFSNQKGEGQLFNVTLMDETGEIRATAFNQVATALYDKLQEGKVYFISRARVSIAKKQFSHLNNEYELGLEKNTEVEECLDTVNVPSVKYSFVELGSLESQEKDSTCDVLAIVKDVSDLSEITSKATNRQIIKRELTLVDKSQFSVRMTLWGKQAEQFNAAEAIIAFKSVKVGDFGGRSLSFFSSSSMAINPDIPAAHALRGWYDECGKGVSYHAHHSSGGSGAAGGAGFNRNEVRSIMDVKSSLLGQNDQTDYFSTRATVVFMKPDTMWYPACQTPDCNKKVMEEGGSWKCEKCDKSWPEPQYRYIMSMACSDWSDQAWLQGFNDVGLTIFGRTADEMVKIKADNDDEFAATVQEATCETFNFLCRAKTDTYNGQPRVRYGISRIQPLNYKEEAMVLRDLILSPWGQTAN